MDFELIMTSSGLSICALTITQKFIRAGKGWKPALAAFGPAFIGRYELINRIQTSQMDLDFITAYREDRRSTFWAEMPALILIGMTFYRNRSMGKNSRRIEHRAMVFTAIKTMAYPYPVRITARLYANTPAQASSCNPVHRFFLCLNLFAHHWDAGLAFIFGKRRSPPKSR